MINKKNILRVIIIILLLLLTWGLTHNWLRPLIIEKLGGYNSMKIKTRVDTVSVEYDSIKFKYDSLVTAVSKLNKPKYIIISKDSTTSTSKGDEFGAITTLDSTLTGAYVTYNPISDTLIEGKIKTVVNPANCEIIAQKLLYKPKFPIIVTKTVTIEKQVEKTLENKRNKIGVGLLYNTLQQIGPTGGYLTKEGWYFQGGLQYQLNQQYDIDKNTKVISIGVTKFF
jgi:hypothetical protein